MKLKTVLILLFVSFFKLSNAQYNKEKLTTLLTGGSTKAWSVKSSNAAEAAKSYTFNINNTVAIANGKAAVQSDKWSLSSDDNIRWFIVLGKEKSEIIVSYDKGGKQYVKLTGQAGNKTPLILYPAN